MTKNNFSLLFLSRSLILFSSLAQFGIGFASSAAPQLFVIDPISKEEFAQQHEGQLKAKLERCHLCEVKNITPYLESGLFDSKGVAKSLDSVLSNEASPAGETVLLLLWNRKALPEDQELLDKVKAIAQKGVLVVATAGRPSGKDPILNLRLTLWGKIPEVMIIGDLTERESLVPGSFFGPQLLTALKTPSEIWGQDTAAILFATRLLGHAKSKKSSDWLSFLHEKRDGTRRIWPTLEDFFGHN